MHCVVFHISYLFISESGFPTSISVGLRIDTSSHVFRIFGMEKSHVYERFPTLDEQ